MSVRFLYKPITSNSKSNFVQVHCFVHRISNLLPQAAIKLNFAELNVFGASPLNMGLGPEYDDTAS